MAEEANFTRAAERVHISQSGVSAQIRQLERELGAVLIDRSSRTATLTPAGQAALEHARAAFHLAHPGVEVTLIEDSSVRLTGSVRVGDVDLALIGCASAPPAGLEALPIVRDRLVACVPGDHPLGARSRVKLAEVGSYPIVCMPPGAGIRAVFDQACAAHGLEAKVALEASAPDTVVDLARRGLGVAILSESMVVDGDGLHRAVIHDVDIPAVLALVWRATTNPALRALLRHCHEAFGLPVSSPRSP